jgi:hypothetical protein
LSKFFTASDKPSLVLMHGLAQAIEMLEDTIGCTTTSKSTRWTRSPAQ